MRTAMNTTRPTTRAQLWTLDYIIGFSLFLIALFLSIHYLVAEAAQHDSFATVLHSTERLSEQLMSTGYPTDWRSDDVVTVGLLTDGRYSPRKAASLLDRFRTDPGATRQLLGTPYDFSLVISERNGTIIPISDHCSIGTATQTRTPRTRTLATAYYHRGTSDYAPAINDLNGTVYTGNELSTLLNSLDEYELVLLENPDLASIRQPYDAQKAALLARFVRRGGTLVIIGKLNLSEAWNLTTYPAPPGDAHGTDSNDTVLSNNTFFNLTNLTLTGLGASARSINTTGLRRYETIAKDANSTSFAAHFTHGDGDVYYLGGTTGTINETGEALLPHLLRALSSAARQASAQCTAVTPPVNESRHLVTVKRLLPYKGRLLTLTITQWEVEQ